MGGVDSMGYLLLTLIVIGILILVFSFIQKNDKVKQLEQQVEGTSITLMQELYKVKKKLKAIEDELMLDQHE